MHNRICSNFTKATQIRIFTELLNAKLRCREKVEKYTAVITDLIKHEEKWSKLLNNIG
jgi:hypothetical protein